MHLREYLSTLERGAATELAHKLGISISFLSQIAAGTSPCAPARCVEIERETNGAVTRRDLREDWASIWPELVESNKRRRKEDDPHNTAPP